MLHTGTIWVFFLDNLCRQEDITLISKSVKNLQGGGAKAGSTKGGMEFGMWRDKVTIMKPLTFMNNSGSVVAAYAKYHNIIPSETLVIHDELDFPCGKAKFKFSGSEGGNNGLKSISSHFGSRDYWRFRIGIGRPSTSKEAVNYVLNPPTPEQREQYQQLTPTILQAISSFVWGDKEATIHSLHTQIG